jgi:hypothetical protein
LGSFGKASHQRMSGAFLPETEKRECTQGAQIEFISFSLFIRHATSRRPDVKGLLHAL